ncbi:hypothetical protein BS614_16295 [Paenibacillus xylanexedens]|uniref:S-layer homology domain-containing protein n=1 Tax=Paenibacillus xylanexedens TaxID=528191 RepID=UPI000938840D|nr:S-layer homology domain-containing protein [Paenibacillus xylanexedens]APO45421.1 hypothetical protein BS614_16295 [Paenibacillus xylanexedens]
MRKLLSLVLTISLVCSSIVIWGENSVEAFAQSDLASKNKPLNTLFKSTQPFTGTVTSVQLPKEILALNNVLTAQMPLEKPANILVDAGEDSISLSWDEVPRADKYYVTIDEVTVYEGTNTTYTQYNLTPATVYNISVIAESENIKGRHGTIIASTKAVSIYNSSYKASGDLGATSGFDYLKWSLLNSTKIMMFYKLKIPLNISGTVYVNDNFSNYLSSASDSYVFLENLRPGEANHIRVEWENWKDATMNGSLEFIVTPPASKSLTLGNIKASYGDVIDLFSEKWYVVDNNMVISTNSTSSYIDVPSEQAKWRVDLKSTDSNSLGNTLRILKKSSEDQLTTGIAFMPHTWKVNTFNEGKFAYQYSSVMGVIGKEDLEDFRGMLLYSDLPTDYGATVNSLAFINPNTLEDISKPSGNQGSAYTGDTRKENAPPSRQISPTSAEKIQNFKFKGYLQPNAIVRGNGTKANPYYVVSLPMVLDELQKPNDPIVRDRKAGQVRISWDLTRAAQIYKIFRDGIEIAQVSAKGITEYTDKDTVAGRTYSYYLIASDGSKDSNLSGVVSVSVSDGSPVENPGPEVVEKPLNFKVNSVEIDAITLSWNAVLGAERYTLRRGNLIIYEGEKLSFKDNELFSNTIFNYSIVASKGYVNSDRALISGKTRANLTYPPNLKVEDLKYNNVNLTWDSVKDAHYYVLTRNNEPITETTSTWFSDLSVIPGETYMYKLVAINGDERSTATETTITVPIEPRVGEAPQGNITLKTTRVYHDKVDLQWNIVQGATSYEVYQDSTRKIWSGTINKMTDYQVGPREDHTYKVVAVNDYGRIESNIAQVLTSDLPTLIIITPSQPLQGAVTFEYQAVEGAVHYVERNPQTKYQPLGNGTYRKTYYNSATGETRDEGIVTTVNGKLQFTEIGVSPNMNYRYDVIAVVVRADGTEQVIAKDSLEVTTPLDGSGATIPDPYIAPWSGGVITPYTGSNNGTNSSPSVSVPGTTTVVDPNVVEPQEELMSKFSDIQKSYAKEAIIKLSNNRVVNGYADGTFKGNKKVTRAEFAIFLNRALGYNLSSPLDGTLKDLDPKAWYAAELYSAFQHGIIKGFDGGFLHPTAYVTREQAASMLSNVLLNKGAVVSSYTPYQDNNEVSLWAWTGVDLVSQESIMKGYPNQKFMPKRDLTREEAAMIIYNLTQWNK